MCEYITMFIIECILVFIRYSCEAAFTENFSGRCTIEPVEEIIRFKVISCTF